MENKNILISGAGIAGPTLAYWLKLYGFNPTIVEQSPVLREGGYAIDFVGAGFEVAEKMGILQELKKADLKIKELVFVDKKGNRQGALNSFHMRGLLNNRYLNLFRSDLSKAIFNHLNTDTETIFGDSIRRIEENSNDTLVTFRSGEERHFDLVVGTDGLHSDVRNLIFGDDEYFEKYFGYYVAAFTVRNYLPIDNPIKTENSYFSHTIPGKQLDIYSINENELTALFIFASDRILGYSHQNLDGQKQILRDEFRDMEWESQALLERLADADDFYFDSVSQIRMEHWSKGRVALLGDSAFAPSLLAGQGSSLAMVAAYILAGELKEANGNYEAAFKQYEAIFKPFIEYKQKVAKSFAHSLVPQNYFSIWLRRTFNNVMSWSFIAKKFVQKYMTDNIELKHYSAAPLNKPDSVVRKQNKLTVLH